MLTFRVLSALLGYPAPELKSHAAEAERILRSEGLLSDEHLQLTRALRLPTFTFDGATLLKRLTLIARHGRIEHVFYPVFPPDTHAQEVIDWLRTHPVAAAGGPA